MNIFKRIFSKLAKLNSKCDNEDHPSLDICGKGREYYETLRYNLLKSKDSSLDMPRLIAITSCSEGEGVSTVASSFAVTLALHGDRVLLVDANFRHPSVHKIFKVNLSPGLGEVLWNGTDGTGAIQPSDIQNLFVLSAGEMKDDPASGYDSQEFAELLNILKREYSFVVFDMLPMQRSVNYVVRLASLLDGVILVVETERVRWQVVQWANERLVKAKANVLGAVLNKREFHVPRWLYDTL